MTYTYGTIREFKTRNFRVIVDAIEDRDLDLSWDDSGETAERLANGDYIAFTARARVFHKDLGEIGSDYLGSCIYESIEDFQDHRQCGAQTRKLRESGSQAVCGSYFSGMIHESIAEARKRLAAAKAIKVRV